jgi:hypothetical protein
MEILSNNNSNVQLLTSKEQLNTNGGDWLSNEFCRSVGYAWEALKDGYKAMGQGVTAYGDYARAGGTR